MYIASRGKGWRTKGNTEKRAKGKHAVAATLTLYTYIIKVYLPQNAVQKVIIMQNP